MALLKDSRFSVCMAYVMHTENQSNGCAHGCDHAQIFCAHGLIHAHRKSRVIGVRMAMCTSEPIIGKPAPRVPGSNKVKQESSYKLLRELSNQVLSSGISKETHISMFISGDTGRGHVSDLVKCDISYDLHYL